MTPHRTRGVVLAALLTLVLTGCTSDGDTPASSSPSATPTESSPSSASDGPANLQGYYGQKLSWSSCRDTFQCAKLRVPLDYAKPGGDSIEIGLLRVKALSPSDRIGSMVVDPGGPGASGMDYAAGAAGAFGKALREHYDVVGLDPRGVGRSDPVDCLSDAKLNDLLSSDPTPDTPAEVRASDAMLKAFGAGCVKRSGALAEHMSTVEVAKDLDVLRSALGDRRLTYFGASYGTAIGSTYADLFPKKVGRMVLDGALNPRSTTLELNLVQAKGFETALRAYVASCIAQGSCVLGSSVDEGTRRIKAFLDAMEDKPLPTSSGRMLTVGDASYGISYPLYDKQGWPILTTALTRAFDGDGSVLMALADGYLDRNTDGSFASNTFEAFYAVNCLDHDDAIPSSQLKRYEPEFDRASPTFGRSFLATVSACQSWPVHTGRGPTTVHGKGAAPIVVIGTTRDPATPLVWARSLAKQLESAVLITRDGDGHTGYRKGSTCVDRAVETYLVSGKAPTQDLSCS